MAISVPNTGGMGAVASRQLVSPEMLERIENEIVQPTVAGLRKEGLPYRGFLYFGLMLTPSGPQIIEYNCRFGDPECQAVMPLVKGDLAGFCLAGAKGELRSDLISFDDGWSVCVILASAGYPETSRSGDLITGLETPATARVYHAGTRKNVDAIGKPTAVACWRWFPAGHPRRGRSQGPRRSRSYRSSPACNAAATSASSISTESWNPHPHCRRHRRRCRTPRCGHPRKEPGQAASPRRHPQPGR
jgi:hypothetical protein